MMLHIIFGCRLIHRAEDKQLLSQLQWGSRPNRSSQDAILMKRLTYDGIRSGKKVGLSSIMMKKRILIVWYPPWGALPYVNWAQVHMQFKRY